MPARSSVLRSILAVLALVLVLGFGAWHWIGGSSGLVGMVIPDFPDLPAPRQTLGANAEGVIHFSTRTPFDFDVILGDMDQARPTTGVGTLFMPARASADQPAPAVVLLHGSGGIQPGREMEYGRFLAENGFAAFVLNYYAPRGVTDETPYMVRVLSVTEFDAVIDAYAALKLLSTHPHIDGDRIGVAGFSYGGMAARFAMDDRIREAAAPGHPGFAAFMDVYGPCFQKLGTTRTNGSALLTLRGTEDASNELPACRARENELRALGIDVEAHVYEGVGHAWEVESPRALHEESPYVTGCTVEYDETGRSSVDGRPVVEVPLETSREERIAIRIASAGPMGDCVQYGYVIGRDEDAKQRANAHLLAFLRRSLTP